LKKRLLCLILSLVLVLSSAAEINPLHARAAENLPELLITEVMPKGQDGDDPYEYIELYNTSENNLDLKNYNLVYPNVDITESKVIPPKGIMVICFRSTTTLESFNKFYGTSLTADKYMALPIAKNALEESAQKTIVLANDDSYVIAAANYTILDFSKKKGINYKYPKSGYEMEKLKAREKATPGTITNKQVPDYGTAVTGIVLDKNYINLKVGESQKITATITPATATNKKISWTSSNLEAVIVDSEGKVTAKGNGVSIITATTEDGGLTARCAVTVSDITVSGVELDKREAAMNVGQAIVLKAKVLPETSNYKTVLWTSSNTKVATVDRNGIVVAKAPGNVTITVKTVYGGFTDKCIINVAGSVNVPVKGISLDKTKLQLEKGKAAVITAKIEPENATNKGVVWTSSDVNIASVDPNGIVVGNTTGSAIILAKTKDGDYTANCVVEVVNPGTNKVPVTGIKLMQTALAMGVGQKELLVAIVAPINATNKNVIFKSDNPSVVTVDERGILTALGQGTATISATSEDGNYTASCKVIVDARSTGRKERIRMNRNILILSPKKSYTLKAVVTPGNGRAKDVIWKSYNEKVATVDSEGKVTANQEGMAIIKVTSKDGSMTDECIVFVFDFGFDFGFDKIRRNNEWNWNYDFEFDWDTEFDCEFDNGFDFGWGTKWNSKWDSKWNKKLDKGWDFGGLFH